MGASVMVWRQRAEGRERAVRRRTLRVSHTGPADRTRVLVVDRRREVSSQHTTAYMGVTGGCDTSSSTPSATPHAHEGPTTPLPPLTIILDTKARAVVVLCAAVGWTGGGWWSRQKGALT